MHFLVTHSPSLLRHNPLHDRKDACQEYSKHALKSHWRSLQICVNTSRHTIPELTVFLIAKPGLLDFHLSWGTPLWHLFESEFRSSAWRTLVIVRQGGPCLWTLGKDIPTVLRLWRGREKGRECQRTTSCGNYFRTISRHHATFLRASDNLNKNQFKDEEQSKDAHTLHT